MMDRGWDLTEMEYPVSNADIVGIYSITHDVAKIWYMRIQSMTTNIQKQLFPGFVPAYACPEGTKMHILNLGTMDVDEGW